MAGLGIDGLHADAAGSFVIFRFVLCVEWAKGVSMERISYYFCGGCAILLIVDPVDYAGKRI